jgi:hypothetical protein
VSRSLKVTLVTSRVHLGEEPLALFFGGDISLLWIVAPYRGSDGDQGDDSFRVCQREIDGDRPAY